jgi:hypothetical protein
MTQSKLQILWSNVSHVIYRELHLVYAKRCLKDLPLGEESLRLIAVRNMTTRSLQVSIRADYDKEKARLLAERK